MAKDAYGNEIMLRPSSNGSYAGIQRVNQNPAPASPTPTPNTPANPAPTPIAPPRQVTNKAEALQLQAYNLAQRAKVNSGTIAPTPPINVTQPNMATQSVGLGSTIDSNAQAYAASVVDTNAMTEAKRNQDASLNAILERITGNKGQVGLTADAYAQDVDPARKELDAINNEILTEEVANKKRIDALLSNGGLTREQAQQQIGEIDRLSVSKRADLAVIQMAKQNNYLGAREIADRKVSAQLEQQKNELSALELTYNANKEIFNKQEQRQFEANQAERTRLLNKEEAELKGVADLAIDALQNGAPTAVVQKMQRAKTREEAIAAGGQYVGKMARDAQKFSQDMQRQSLAISRANLAINQKELQMKLDANKPLDVSKLVSNPNIPSEQKNTAILTSLLSNSKIDAGAKTQIANVLGVTNSLQDLANVRPKGNFEGVGPVTIYGRLPFVNSKESIENNQYLNAINLKVQQWASGASLTAQQTEQVNKLTPKDTDTDFVFRQKMNGLANFMNTQAQSQLQSQGITFKPERVNLFETADLYNSASKEQKKEIDRLLKEQIK